MSKESLPLGNHLGERGSTTRARNETMALLEGWERFIVETIVLLALMTAADAFFFAGDRFTTIQPHPFWIVVLLVSSQYGVLGGVFATLCASACLYVGALPARAVGADFYAYAAHLAERPAAWFIAALILGGLRTWHQAAFAKVASALAQSERRAGVLHDGLTRGLAEIDRLERRIAGDTSTVDAVLRGLSRADLHTPRALVASLHGFVKDVLGVAACALYLRGAAGMEPIIDAADEEWQAPRLREALVAEAGLLDALSAARTLTRQDGDLRDRLPAGAIILAPIIAARGAVLHGAILVDRLSGSEHSTEAVAHRASHLGQWLGATIDAIGEPPKVLPRTGSEFARVD